MKAIKWIQAIALCGTFALCGACGGGSSTHTAATTPTSGTANNVAPITVNSGPAGGYVDGAFASVTVCVPGTSTCQTVDGLLVDTGSTGVRILSSALTINLAQQKTSSGSAVVECLPFLDSYTWGPVETADVEIAGEKASLLPIQVLSDSDFTVASGCANFGLTSADTLDTLGANGILGVGLYAQDCGSGCEQTGSANPGLYYACSSSTSCQVTEESTAQQVQNPVALFATDNNGVIIELPAASTPEASLSGSLIFGIGTQSNNALGTATIYTPNDLGNFTTTYKGKSYSNSFIDSGSNGFYFLDTATTGMAECSDATGFYCPASTETFAASVQGANGTSGSVSFSIANADTLFNANGAADTVFNDLGGPSPNSFDFGLPFFLGKNVFAGIQSTTYPNGYWAY